MYYTGECLSNRKTFQHSDLTYDCHPPIRIYNFSAVREWGPKNSHLREVNIERRRDIVSLPRHKPQQLAEHDG